MALLLRRVLLLVYSDYRKYKPFLREDFNFRCVFCSIHENEWGGPRHFHVEHFRPKSDPRFAHLECDYTNLLYSCDICNSFKGAKWPSDDPLVDEIGFLDPCVYDFEEHFVLSRSYILEGLSGAAKYMVEEMHLNRKQLIKVRERRVQLKTDHENTLVLLNELMFMAQAVIINQETLYDKKLNWQKVYDLTREKRDKLKVEWSMRNLPVYQIDDFN